jgi:hypothetical protein
MCAEMDLFSIVKLEKPKQVTVGVRPLREGEQPLLEETEGRLTVLPEVVPENTPPLQVTHVQSVAPEAEARTESSDSVEVLGPDHLKRKGDAESSGTSKRRRHMVVDEESSAEEEAVATNVEEEAAEVSPPR